MGFGFTVGTIILVKNVKLYKIFNNKQFINITNLNFISFFPPIKDTEETNQETDNQFQLFDGKFSLY